LSVSRQQHSKQQQQENEEEGEEYDAAEAEAEAATAAAAAEEEEAQPQQHEPNEQQHQIINVANILYDIQRYVIDPYIEAQRRGFVEILYEILTKKLTIDPEKITVSFDSFPYYLRYAFVFFSLSLSQRKENVSFFPATFNRCVNENEWEI
jgi:hypothetical protein